MTYVISASSSYTQTGSLDVSVTGATIPLPNSLAIGDYIIAGVFFAQAAGTTAFTVPAGWTSLTPAGISSNRLLVTFGYKIINAAALTAIGTSFEAKANSTATRVVANVHRLTHVDLAATVSGGAVEYSNSLASSYVFNQPAGGDSKMFFVAANTASPSTGSVFTSTGGGLLVQTRRSLASSGASSDSQLSSFYNGTGANSGVATTNHVSVGVGFTSLPGNASPVASFTTSVNGYALTATSASVDYDGTIANHDWDWGDGTVHGSSATAVHSYVSAGTYTVTLTVTDNNGATNSSASQVIIIGSVTRPVIVGTPTTGITTIVTAKSIVINKPVGLVDGEWLIAALRSQDAVATADFTSSGWSRLGSAFVSSSTAGRLMGFYAKYIPSAAAEVAASYTFTWEGGGGRVAGTMLRIRGADSVNLVDVTSPYTSNGIPLGARLPAISAAHSNGLQLAIAANEQTSPNASESTSHTAVFNLVQFVTTAVATTGSRTTIELYQRNQDAGATPQMEVNWQNVSSANIQSVVLRGASTANISPAASFTTAVSNLTVSVTNTSTDSDGTIASYDWDWGDGTIHATTASANHTYVTAGTYVVVQTVTDNNGATGSANRSVTVPASTAPVPHFGIGNSTSTVASGGATLSIAKPTNLTDGDVLVANVYTQFAGGLVTAVPTGWTLLRGYSTRAGGVYVKPVPTASLETAANYAWTISASARLAGTIFRVTGADLTTPLDVAGTQPAESGNVTTITSASITTTSVESLLVGVHFWNNSSSTVTLITPPASMTAGVQVNTPTTSNTSGTLVSYQPLITAGATGTRAFVLNPQATNGSGFLFAIRKVGPNPRAAFITSASGLTATVDARSSAGTHGATIANYDWNWGDGTTHGNGLITTHNYADRGTFTIVLTTTDNNGLTGILSRAVVVTDGGYPAVYRDTGGTNYPGIMYYWDGTTKHAFNDAPINHFTPVTVTQFLADNHAPWFAAHRGFSNSYPEESLYSYRAATDFGIKAIEVSVQYSANGTPWCFHDNTTTRTTGYVGTISALSDITIAALSNLGTTASQNPGQPSRPTAKLVDVLDMYASTHVIVIEDKTYTHTTSLLNLMDSYGTPGRPANEIFIWKAASSAGSVWTSATARGYHRWAYIFDSEMATIGTVAASGKADMIGMDYNSSDATLTAGINACLANGVKPTGHIVNSAVQRDRLIALGMKGIMISNKDIVPPWYVLWAS